jgi:pantetheine-phosphate adenylyltransferase
MDKQYKAIGLGGTFDHFHVGHQHFLQFAAGLADEVYVGITTKETTTEKILAETIETYEKRENAVENYLASLDVQFQVFPLTDIYGPTLENSPVEAIAVTEATIHGGEAINAERNKRHLTELPIHQTNLLRDSSGGYISSTRIRLGEIDRNGKVFSEVFTKDLILSETQRSIFREKQGELVKSPNVTAPLRYVVGDIVLETFLNAGWDFNLGIFDGKNNREEYVSEAFSTEQIKISVDNPASQISSTAIADLKPLLQENAQLIQVNGEEDLLAVALVLLVPLQSTIYYGQQNEGMVEMVVTAELKEKFYSVLANK